MTSAKLDNAIFVNANVSDCNFEGSNAAKADFSNAIKESAFKGKVLTAAELLKEYSRGRRDFSGVCAPNSDFSGQNLAGIILRRANLHFCSFNHTDLTGADLSGADLTDCAFDNTILRNASLSKANLYWSRIKGAIMENANLKDANLSWCNLSGTDFSGCDLSKANVQWSLVVGTKFSDGQFFAFSPDVLETLKLASFSATETKRTASAPSHHSYLSIDKGAGEYMRKGENVLVYGERGFEVASMYSPKEKKHFGGYVNR